LYAKGSVLFHYNETNVFRSTDLGYSWNDITSQFPRGAQSISETSNGTMIALAPNNESGATVVLRSADDGATWRTASAFAIEPMTKIVDVILDDSRLVAISTGRTINVSDDQGITWKESRLPNSVGSINDVAMAQGIWIAVGTEQTVWSSDRGIKWNPSPSPAEIGNLNCVESNAGKIWAGGLRGTCWFDVQSRSWVVESTGLVQYAQITESPNSLISYGSVLFGVFSTLDGSQSVCSRQSWQESWQLVSSFGLPTFNSVQRRSIAVINDRLFVYHRGNDETTRGIYEAQHAVAVGVDDVQLAPVQVSIWPNPVADALSIRTTELQNVHVTISDALGMTWLTQRFDGSANLDVSVLPCGQYFLLAKTSSTTYAVPVTIQR